jgi:hypothetical protein
MDWMMNLEEAKEGFLVDGGAIEAGGDSASEEKQTAGDQDKPKLDSKETLPIIFEGNDSEEENTIEKKSPEETMAGDE